MLGSRVTLAFVDKIQSDACACCLMTICIQLYVTLALNHMAKKSFERLAIMAPKPIAHITNINTGTAYSASTPLTLNDANIKKNKLS